MKKEGEAEIRKDKKRHGKRDRRRLKWRVKGPLSFSAERLTERWLRHCGAKCTEWKTSTANRAGAIAASRNAIFYTSRAQYARLTAILRDALPRPVFSTTFFRRSLENFMPRCSEIPRINVSIRGPSVSTSSRGPFVKAAPFYRTRFYNAPIVK